jgi:GNAT superfamily N-acetyltransferase
MPVDPLLSPSGNTVQTYLGLAEGTGAFRPCELEILEEVLRETFSDPGKGYLFVERQEGGSIVAFAVFGRSPMTAWAWDLYWIVVGKPLQGKGFGKRILEDIEGVAVSLTGRVILRVETSGRQDYEGQRHFYLRTGFRETGRIPDFYEAGDDLVTYCKFIF